MSNPNFSPIVWVNSQTGFDYPIAIWQVSNPNFSPTVWINFQTESDYPIVIQQSVKIPIFPRPFGRISKLGLITQLRFDKVSNPNFFPNRLDKFPNRVWLPNCDLTKCQIPIFPQSFGLTPKPGLITQLRFDKYQIPVFPWPFGLIFKLGPITQLQFDKVSNPNFYPDRLNEFPNWVWLPNCDLTKCQIPIFPQPFGLIFKPGPITQLRFDKVSKSQFFPYRLDGFPNRVWLPNCDLTKCQIQIFSPTILNQEYDPHIDRHRFPKIFQNETECRKAHRILVMWESIFSLMHL